MKTVSGILGAALVAAGIGFSAPASADKILVAELTGTIQYDSNAPLATQPTVFDPLTPVGGEEDEPHVYEVQIEVGKTTSLVVELK